MIWGLSTCQWILTSDKVILFLAPDEEPRIVTFPVVEADELMKTVALKKVEMAYRIAVGTGPCGNLERLCARAFINKRVT